MDRVVPDVCCRSDAPGRALRAKIKNKPASMAYSGPGIGADNVKTLVVGEFGGARVRQLRQPLVRM
jgi:hypothetical protein